MRTAFKVIGSLVGILIGLYLSLCFYAWIEPITPGLVWRAVMMLAAVFIAKALFEILKCLERFQTHLGINTRND
jgi:hypothetical protein